MTEEDYRGWYAAAFPRLVGQIYLIIGDLAEAQDVVQEAFVRAWNHRRRFAGGEMPDAWVRTVAHRLAVSRWRSARSALAAWQRSGPPPPVRAPGEETALVAKALQGLPERQRTAVVLHYLCDLSVEQVAAEMGAPAGSVKAWLSRGRGALRHLLSDENVGSDS